MKNYQPNDQESREIVDFIYDSVQKEINVGREVYSGAFEKKLSLPFDFVTCNALITCVTTYVGDFPEPTYEKDCTISLGPVYGMTEDECQIINININHLENSRIYEH